jgi:hypothetical protein
MAIESEGKIIGIIEGSILIFYKSLNHKYSFKGFNSLIKFSAYKAAGDEKSKAKWYRINPNSTRKCSKNNLKF